ncbi:hypothetical protein [Streptomyces olivochromogenes]|uniref:Secreted protein n=1 Tax=Streptomyces olivochromogenes TaxID=1963 RepID=A0A250VIE6_STROL|nr:hypothetical protein [Streptomyces olivochromogenes]KUN43269.1 hypothetical protein AQJ27_32400 [Streptomyces olivochromogenes]GAX53967.1 hypothetical protein SO3561_05499 [Streptomyces olivochromogenes]
MFSFKRFGSAVASAAALASLSMAIAPAAIAASDPQPVVQESKGPKPPTTPTECVTLSGQLSTQLQAAATALAATPTANVAAAQAAVTAAQITVAQLRAAGCLPEAPPTPPTCASLALQLQAQLKVLAAALATFPQNPANITAALNAVIATAAQLTTVCT